MQHVGTNGYCNRSAAVQTALLLLSNMLLVEFNKSRRVLQVNPAFPSLVIDLESVLDRQVHTGRVLCIISMLTD